ncbi:hypothetical protein C0058_07580 [Pseudomonas sp. NC02]|nr:hypothetical protein C0058_07580 [Pseudomonas sp. NC02]
MKVSYLNAGTQSNVGAGLLANAVYQPTYLSTDRPHSRASPLPHLIFIFSTIWPCLPAPATPD